MYKKNYMFHTPEYDTVVWRYIDFTKFVDLLTSSKLFFCRADNLHDPYEGIFRLKDYEKTKHMLQYQEPTKKFYFLNCWHMNENQSDAMWKIFLNINNGIAIKSTVRNIIKSLENSKDDVHIGRVYYRDFEKVTLEELMSEEQNRLADGRGSGVVQYNYKRKSFEHEKELRLFHIDKPIPHLLKNGVPRDPLNSKHIDVDLVELINEIVIAPFADKWFQEMVERLLSILKLNFRVIQSDLYRLKY